MAKMRPGETKIIYNPKTGKKYVLKYFPGVGARIVSLA